MLLRFRNQIQTDDAPPGGTGAATARIRAGGMGGVFLDVGCVVWVRFNVDNGDSLGCVMGASRDVKYATDRSLYFGVAYVTIVLCWYRRRSFAGITAPMVVTYERENRETYIRLICG